MAKDKILKSVGDTKEVSYYANFNCEVVYRTCESGLISHTLFTLETAKELLNQLSEQIKLVEDIKRMKNG